MYSGFYAVCKGLTFKVIAHTRRQGFVILQKLFFFVVKTVRDLFVKLIHTVQLAVGFRDGYTGIFRYMVEKV